MPAAAMKAMHTARNPQPRPASAARRGALSVAALLPALFLGASLALAAPLAQAHADHPHGSSQPGAVRADGVVKQIDRAGNTLTIAHGPLENLGMPAMTMRFVAQNPRWLERLQVGDRVSFIAEEVKGKLTVTSLKLVK